MRSYVYLHGFASSPRSIKAQYLHDRFCSLGLTLHCPDLNQNDFYTLTLSRQIQQVESLLLEAIEANVPVTLIGSSFGGLTAAWLTERCPQVDRLILLAPAFQFLEHWLPKLGTEQIDRWRTEDAMLTYHYSEQKMLPISYQIVTDLTQYDEATLQRPIPTLILHGQQDEVIPIAASRSFAAQRPWVRLIELNSDHALGDVQSEIWQAIRTFCQLQQKDER